MGEVDLIYRDQARILRLLAHPVRLRILYALLSDGQYVCHLVTLLGCRQPVVSKHLAVLRAGRLVVGVREGNHILYRMNRDWPTRLVEWLAQEHQDAIRPSRREAWRLGFCFCPRCVRRRKQERAARYASQAREGSRA